MKKVISIFLSTILATTLLAGCGHTHVWQDATCTAAKTCTECQETEGEVLAHTFGVATCSAAKTCTVCSATEGEALAHTLTPANYQSAAICTVCKASEGEKLPAVFAEKGITLMETDKEYDYISIGYSDHSVVQTNHVTIENYRIVASDDTHAAKDGYEWRIAEVNYSLDDPSVASVSWKTSAITVNYYTGLIDYSDITIVSFNGVDYEITGEYEVLKKEKFDNGNGQYIIEISAQVPVGYDGVVICAYNSAYSKPVTGTALKTLDDLSAASPLFFRMA